MKITDLSKGLKLEGLVAGAVVSIVDVELLTTEVANLTYRLPDGKIDSRILYENDLVDCKTTSPWDGLSFNCPEHAYKLTTEAERINLAYLFDPYMAVNTSSVEPLPHQITAVYEKMLQKHPLRYVLADDPGAGKTIMTGLLLKELMLRFDFPVPHVMNHPI